MAALLLATLVFAPYWSSEILPLHDSLFQYQFFHYVYSQIVTAGEIPMWAPYGSYGIATALYQLTTLTPASCLVGAIGAVLGAQDTLALFKLGVFLEVLLYATGLLLLARLLYEHVLARVFLVAGGLCSLSWLFQPHLNFQAFYLYPVLLFFLVAFLREGDPAKLWLAAATAVFSVFGTAPYLAVLHLYIIALILGVALAAGIRPPLVRDVRRWLWRWEAGLALGLIAIYAASAWFGLSDIVLASPGREDGSGRVPVEVFLEHGRRPVLTMVYGYLSGAITHADNTYYIGLLALALVVLGMVRWRTPLFLGIAAAALVLIWLSFGGWFARLVYWFPVVPLFRHIDLTSGVAGLLLLIAAGQVLDRVLARDAPTLRGWSGIAVPLLLSLMALDLFLSWRPTDALIAPINQPALLVLMPLRLFAYVIAIIIVLHRRGGEGTARTWAPLVAVFVLDVGLYQASVWYTLPRSRVVLPAGAFAPDAVPYRDRRVDVGALVPVPGWKLALMEPRVTYLGPMTLNSSIYSFNYTFLGVDPCYPRFRNDAWQRAMYEALAARGAHRLAGVDAEPALVDDLAFRQSAGCDAPKIRLEGGRTRVTRFSANRVEIEIFNDGGGPALLRYADAYHPDWRAFVDGVVTPVRRADVAFKAVDVPPGRHVVTLVFGSGARRVAGNLLAFVSGAGFLLCVVCAGAALWRRGNA